MSGWHPSDLLQPRRRITGMSAVLLPYADSGEVDWDSFQFLLDRTVESGLVPAVNMDTGFAHLIDETTRLRVLDLARASCGPEGFVAGAFVLDEPGAELALDAYKEQVAAIVERGGTPIVFPSHGLTALPGPEVVDAHRSLAALCDSFLAFELGTMFATFGRIYDLDTCEGLLSIDACVGAKHSSLDRSAEWARLRLRDRARPGFKVLTGNDLAVDMVMYGSDYLLGLSAFAPDLFARRDFSWEIGHPDFYELNDKLQFLGAFAFRPPVPAYRHSAAQFLHLRGWLPVAATHPASPRRPGSDVEILRGIVESLGL